MIIACAKVDHILVKLFQPENKGGQQLCTIPFFFTAKRELLGWFPCLTY